MKRLMFFGLILRNQHDNRGALKLESDCMLNSSAIYTAEIISSLHPKSTNLVLVGNEGK